MNCPVCSKEMLGEDFEGIFVHVCDSGCKGIWFDWSELTKLDHKTNQAVSEAMQAALNTPRHEIDHGQLKCPKCSMEMHRHEYTSDKEVNVYECYQCGGFFLDPGDLKEIREHSMTDGQQEAYAQKLQANIPSYVKAESDLQKYEQRTAAIAQLTKFVRLSYYATGQ